MIFFDNFFIVSDSCVHRRRGTTFSLFRKKNVPFAINHPRYPIWTKPADLIIERHKLKGPPCINTPGRPAPPRKLPPTSTARPGQRHVRSSLRRPSPVTSSRAPLRLSSAHSCLQPPPRVSTGRPNISSPPRSFPEASPPRWGRRHHPLDRTVLSMMIDRHCTCTYM